MNISKRLVLIALSIILAVNLFSSATGEETNTWVCPNCGRTGNTGYFCGNCAYPSPAPKSGPTRDVFSFDKLVRMYDTNCVKQFYDIREDAKKWISWTTNSAPQSLKELPLFPDFILPLYQSLTEASQKLHYEIEDTGNTYTVRSNIAEKFILLSSGEYYNNLSSRSNEVELLLDENISGSVEHNDIKLLDSPDASISFSYPEGSSVIIEELKYEYKYIYYGNVQETIIISIREPESGNPSICLDVRFGDDDTSIDYQVFGPETMEIQISDLASGVSGMEWLEYDLQSGELLYWDMAYYEAEDDQ